MATSTPPKKSPPKAKAPVKAKKKAVSAELSAAAELPAEATETGLILIDEPTPVEAAPAPAPAEARAAPTADPSREEVGRRAYELWLARGGSAFENWVEAERQLRRR